VSTPLSSRFSPCAASLEAFFSNLFAQLLFSGLNLMKTKTLGLVLLLLNASFSVQAGEGRTQLDKYLAEFNTLEASFSQELADEKGAVRQRSQGKVYLQRPGKFRWEYQKPYEQLIVADGKKVWIYDKDLEQVTAKPLHAAIGNTPALLLGGQVNIEKEFTISEDGRKEGLQWLTLKPQGKENQYSDIRLGFEGSTLRNMELHDNFGQTTRIRFAEEQRNKKLAPSLFEFKPPAGVDVMDASEGM
jgi:chaperone LolA